MSQQFLVESVVGIQTVKASAVEPIMQAQWEERLAAYVRRSFFARPCSALSARTPCNTSSESTTALLLLFGAKAVIDGELTVGALVAFNMIAGADHSADPAAVATVAGFPAGQVSVERLGDILNTPPEPSPAARAVSAAAAARR